MNHLNKQGKVAEGMAETMENVEGHLSTLNDHMKKLIEIQQKNVTEGGRSTNVPVAPRMDSGVAPSAAAKAATLGTTGRAAKAMPVAPGSCAASRSSFADATSSSSGQSGFGPTSDAGPQYGRDGDARQHGHVTKPPQFYGQGQGMAPGQGMPPGQDVTMSAQQRYKRITEGLELIE